LQNKNGEKCVSKTEKNAEPDSGLKEALPLLFHRHSGAERRHPEDGCGKVTAEKNSLESCTADILTSQNYGTLIQNG